MRKDGRAPLALPGDVLPDLLEGEELLLTEIPCGQIVASLPQRHMVNMLAATVVTQYLTTLFADGTLIHSKSCFDARRGYVKSYPAIDAVNAVSFEPAPVRRMPPSEYLLRWVPEPPWTRIMGPITQRARAPYAHGLRAYRLSCLGPIGRGCGRNPVNDVRARPRQERPVDHEAPRGARHEGGRVVLQRAEGG